MVIPSREKRILSSVECSSSYNINAFALAIYSIILLRTHYLLRVQLGRRLIELFILFSINWKVLLLTQGWKNSQVLCISDQTLSKKENKYFNDSNY